MARRYIRLRAPRPLHPPRQCTILGPVSAGKTSIIAAIERACLYAANELYRLSFIPDPQGGTNTQDLIIRATRMLLHREEPGEDEDPGDAGPGPASGHERGEQRDTGGWRATLQLEEFPFQIRGQVPVAWWEQPNEFTMNVTMYDPPGGAVYLPENTEEPHPFRAEAMERARESDALVFAFDINLAQSAFLDERMHQLLTSIVDRTIDPQHPRLRARRVLILMNKVDQLAARLAREAYEAWKAEDELHFPAGGAAELARSSGHAPSWNVERLARDIDPVAMAVECLEPSLQRIRACMRPGASLAVCACSAWGFGVDGVPLVNEDGQPERFDNVADDNAFIRQWRPFGLRDAVLYLASGIARGQVVEVSNRELLRIDVDRRAMELNHNPWRKYVRR